MPMLPDLEPHLLYTREFCGKQLRWHFVQDPCDRHKAPDVVFDDITFCPIVDASNEEQRQLAELLDGWSTATDSHPLTALIKLLLSLYTEHQRNRIAAVEDDRILFELAMVAELGCTEMLLAASADSQAQQACFVIPVHPDLSASQQLVKYLQISSNSSNNSNSPASRHNQQQKQQLGTQLRPHQDEQEQQQFALHVAFKVGPGVDSHTAPDLRLQTPSWFRDYLPSFNLPSWDPQTSLLEYVPHLTERLDKHLQDTCPAATLRFDLVNALAGVLGSPVEVNMRSSKATGSTSSGMSSSAAATAAAAGGKGRYSSVAMFQVIFDQQVMLLFVELGPAFPGDAPVLVLQNLRRQGAESYTTLSSVPWSPRWPVDEMTARLFNFIKQQAANVMKEPAPQSAAASPVPGGL